MKPRTLSLIAFSILALSAALAIYLVGQMVVEKMAEPSIKHFSYKTSEGAAVGFEINSPTERFYHYIVSWNASHGTVAVSNTVRVCESGPFTYTAHIRPEATSSIIVVNIKIYSEGRLISEYNHYIMEDS